MLNNRKDQKKAIVCLASRPKFSKAKVPLKSPNWPFNAKPGNPGQTVWRPGAQTGRWEGWFPVKRVSCHARRKIRKGYTTTIITLCHHRHVSSYDSLYKLK